MPQVILKSKVSTVYLDKESEQLNKRIKKKGNISFNYTLKEGCFFSSL